MSDLKKWIRIRKDLYLQMERQVRHRLGDDIPELRQYRDTYDKEFKKKWTAVSKEVLFDQIEKSQLVIMGDFHALHQSQKAQLRILRHLSLNKKIILAVEFFEAGDQLKIDKYLAGAMSEKKFLEEIQWHKKWGFPWEHYKPIIHWARKNNVVIQGLNRSFKKRNAANLKSRDLFAAKKIAQLFEKNPDHLIFVIYGDYHLAQNHIPEKLESFIGKTISKKMVRIFQNSESIYFKLLESELEASTDLVMLSKNAFCLMSVPPWVKWQNYLMYLEQTYDFDLNEKVKEEVSLDYTDHVSRYVKIIAEELNLSVPVSALSVYTAGDPTFWANVRKHYDGRKRRWIEMMISEGASFYLPEIKAAYLARGTVNHAASLAMRYIHSQINGVQSMSYDPKIDFIKLIWLEGVAYFGSKIINHKRKANTIADIKISLESKNSLEMGKEALQLALSQKMNEMRAITGANNQLSVRPREKWSYFMAANLLGGMLGERLYAGYRKKIITATEVGNFIKVAIDDDMFLMNYYKIIRVAESLPIPFYSKRERL